MSVDPEAAELAAASRPEKNYGWPPKNNVASRKPAEKDVRLSRRKIMRLVDKNYTETVQLCFKYKKKLKAILPIDEPKPQHGLRGSYSCLDSAAATAFHNQPKSDSICIESESYTTTVCDSVSGLVYSQNPLIFGRTMQPATHCCSSWWSSLYLGISAWFVPVEIIFFIACFILNCWRSSLALWKLHKICFLHDNFKFTVDSLPDIDVGMPEDDRDACLE